MVRAGCTRSLQTPWGRSRRWVDAAKRQYKRVSASSPSVVTHGGCLYEVASLSRVSSDSPRAHSDFTRGCSTLLERALGGPPRPLSPSMSRTPSRGRPSRVCSDECVRFPGPFRASRADGSRSSLPPGSTLVACAPSGTRSRARQCPSGRPHLVRPAFRPATTTSPSKGPSRALCSILSIRSRRQSRAGSAARAEEGRQRCVELPCASPSPGSLLIRRGGRNSPKLKRPARQSRTRATRSRAQALSRPSQLRRPPVLRGCTTCCASSTSTRLLLLHQRIRRSARSAKARSHLPSRRDKQPPRRSRTCSLIRRMLRQGHRRRRSAVAARPPRRRRVLLTSSRPRRAREDLSLPRQRQLHRPAARPRLGSLRRDVSRTSSPCCRSRSASRAPPTPLSSRPPHVSPHSSPE
ncbi:hypothetical protein DMC30DRAFT_137891 [Rhodotorula diobovata]|uniref:Uncharacterized protein n=1 Tax=Rhodotorula diobovata TaxID=5288 RepID=A0A5C5FLV1_9BASI|nr:hypothetical protein DMC30DRAFT_137891 [Rhodotorula diobovata]